MLRGLLCFPQKYELPDLHLTSDPIMVLDEGWIIEYRDQILENSHLPLKAEVEPGQILRLTNTLPHMEAEGLSMCMRASTQSISVYVDREMIYQRGTEDRPYPGSVLGSSWNLVTFPEGSDGKELTIELYSPYLPYAGNAGIVLLGSRSACMLWVIEKYGVGLVIALLILLLGLIQTILHGISASLRSKNL